MYFTVNSTTLTNYISTVSKAMASKNALPILDNILIEQNEGKIKLTASDAENYLVCEFDTNDYEGSMKIVLDAKHLLAAIKEISDQPVRFETANGQEVTILYLNGKYNMVSAEAQAYPQNTFRSENNILFTIDSKNLCNGVNNCIFATANDELRPQMNGVYFDTTPNGLIFVASDGHKLAKNRFDNPEGITGASFDIPKKTIKLISAMMGKGNTVVSVSVAENKSMATFFINEYILSCRLIEGRYPNYESVIPKEHLYTAVIDKDNLLSAIRRVQVSASSASNLVKFHFEGTSLVVSTQDIDFSKSAEERLEIDSTIDRIDIGLNGDMMREILIKIPGESVIMNFSDPTRPAVFTPTTQSEDGEEILMLLMPMMLQD